MARRNYSRHKLYHWLTAPRIVVLLLGVIGILIGFSGYLYHYCECQAWPNLVAGWEQLFKDFYANVAASLVTVTITVLTIDWLNERRAGQQLKAQLIREMDSTDNGIALRATRELSAYGWIEDGSLRRAFLREANLRRVILNNADLQEAKLHDANLQEAALFEANLQEADLSEANLRGAGLSKANLQEADLHGADLQEAELYRANLRGAILSEANLCGALLLTDRQLATVCILRDAVMPDGSRYGGMSSARAGGLCFHSPRLEPPGGCRTIKLEVYSRLPARRYGRWISWH